MRELLGQADHVAEAALAVGALEPITSALEIAPDKGVDFQVRTRTSPPRSRPFLLENPEFANPFLPYDRRLFVGDCGPDHVCLLNKYPVFDRHLLLVTRAFADQQKLLQRADLVVAADLVRHHGGLVFYNGGEEAGASQAHRHIQWIPLPLSTGGSPLPIEAALDELPFPHGLTTFPPGPSTEDAWEGYCELMDMLGLVANDGWQAQPYNLLLTAKWMLIVPRRRERWKGLSVNALGYAGSFLVDGPESASALRAAGGMQILTELAG